MSSTDAVPSPSTGRGRATTIHRTPLPHQSKLPAIAVTTVALLVGGMLIYSAGDVLRPAKAVNVEPVVFERVMEAPAESVPDAEGVPIGATVAVQAPGWLEADPFITACTALADGVVEEMLVLEGERVEAGQVVARLVSEDAELALARAEAEVLISGARFDLSQADLRAAKTDWENPVERDRAVASTRASLAETDAELSQLPALVQIERATLERMDEGLKRSAAALESDGVSEYEHIIYEKDVQAQAARLEATERRREILVSRRDRLRADAAAAEKDAQLRIIERHAYDVAKANVASAHADVANAEARRDEAQLRLDRMTILSPISGFVQRRLKVPGDKVMLAMDEPHSAHLIHVYDPSKLQVRVDVPLADASYIRVDQRCEVIVDVLPDRTFKGVVTRITHEADLQKNTLQVKVRVIDPPAILKPEMLTRVKFLPSSSIRERDRAQAETSVRAPVLVPESALRDHAGETARVWAVRNRQSGAGVAAPIDLEILSIEKGVVRARGDLRPGELLVTDQIELKAGQRLKIARAPKEGDAR